MLVLVRWIGRLFKKEYRFLARYERTHPHFFWYALTDALISILLVVGGFQLYSHLHSTSPAEEWLERSGAVGMSAAKFIDHVRADGSNVYWLGEKQGSIYTFNHSSSYLRIVTYIPSGSSVNEVAKPELVVETYSTEKDLTDHVHVFTNMDADRVVTRNGVTVRYSPSDLKTMKVSISGVPEAIVVEYPKEQSEAKLLNDAASITLVK